MGVDVAHVGKVGISLPVTEVRLRSNAIFAYVKLLLRDNLVPTTQAVGAGNLSCGESSMTWGAAARISPTARRLSFTRTPADAGAWTTLVVKLDLWRRLRAQLETFGGSFTERQHWMALDDVVPQSLLAEMQRLEFVCRSVSYHRTLAQQVASVPIVKVIAIVKVSAPPWMPGMVTAMPRREVYPNDAARDEKVLARAAKERGSTR